MEYVFDDDVQLDSSEVYWRSWVPGLLVTENRGPRDFARLCQVQRGLQTDLPAFFDFQWFIAYRERSEGMLEKVSIDIVFLVKHDLSKRGYRNILEFTNCERLDLDEVPFMGKLQNGYPLLNTGIVKGIFSTQQLDEARKFINEDLRVIKYPKEALEVDLEYILEN